MSRVVRRNSESQLALGSLNKNNDKLRRALKKVSSGQKIVGADDSSSAYVISEKMREQIRTLAQDHQNIQNGATLLKIADGGINSIVEELRSLKELAINSANDTNTNQDRATLQKVFRQKMENINDIATTTNYNSKTLLDGSFAKGKEYEVEHTTIEWTDNEPIKISTRNYVIKDDGYYMLASDYRGELTVKAKNVRLTQEDPTTALSNIYITCDSGDKNLWIKDLNIDNPSNYNSDVIQFQGSGNYLNVEGTNTVKTAYTGGNFAVKSGNELTVLGDGKLTVVTYPGGVGIGNTGSTDDIIIGGNVTIEAVNINGGGGRIGARYSSNIGNIKICGNANVTTGVLGGVDGGGRTGGNIIIGGNANVTATNYIGTSGNGSTGDGRMGDIIIGGHATVNAGTTTNDQVAIGCGNVAGRGSSYCGDIIIGDYATVNVIGTIGSGNNSSFSGTGYSICGEILIGNNAKVNVTTNSSQKAGIGAGSGKYNDNTPTCGDIKIGNNAIVTVNSTSTSGWAALIGSGYTGHASDIIISGNANVTTSFTSNFMDAAGIGSGGFNASVGDIKIGGNAKVTTSSGYGAAIGSGRPGSVGNISIGGNAVVNATSTTGAGIGSGYTSSSAGNITIGDNATVNAQSRFGTGIGSTGNASSVGNITINNGATVNASGINGNNIGTHNGTVGTITYADNVSVNVADISLSLAKVVTPATPDKPGATKHTITTTSIERSDDSPLKIHHGAKSHQATNFYIEDMHTKSLGTGKLINADGTFKNDSDKQKYIALGLSSDSMYQTDKQAEWLATVTAAQNKTLDDISVTTKYNSNIAIRVLDGAIDYALDQATQIGSYLQRLEYTDANVTTMGENVQSAESTIRDADMAKEMTEYKKFNVLQQSAQAMLAQANQNSSGVLSLIQ
ncbi:MAG: hypothetical protein IK062_03250 [Selenomonadaceae bacterium]|nr:hypothetical protein [Selenomonadaceae bacterium]